MSKLDYIRFVQAFDDFFEREKVDCMASAPPPLDDNGEPPDNYASEPYFSWQPCGCCGDSDGGNREDYLAFNANIGDGPDVELEVSICENCIFFNEYGNIGDTPMLEVDRDTATVTLKDGRKVLLDGAADGRTIQSSTVGPVNIADIDLDAE